MVKSTRDTNFQFIREKIYRLHTAIMYSMSNELIKIPNSIITVLKVDEDGHLWFQCKAPVQYIHQYEQSFPVRLHFFRKGFTYFLEVSGGATIVKGQENDYTGEVNTNDRSLLLRMNINAVEYVEPQTKKNNRIEELAENGYNWLFRTISNSWNKSFLAKLQRS